MKKRLQFTIHNTRRATTNGEREEREKVEETNGVVQNAIISSYIPYISSVSAHLKFA